MLKKEKSFQIMLENYLSVIRNNFGIAKVIKIILVLLVFLLPLFWLPFSFDTYEFNKSCLLFLLTSFAFLIWTAKSFLKDKEINFKLTSLDISVLIFLLIGIASAIFSLEKTTSLFGFYGRFSNGLIGFLSFGAFYFLIRNNISANINKKPKDSMSSISLLKIFIFSCSFIILTAYFSIFRIWEKFSINYPFMLQRMFNLASISLEGLAVFISILISLLVGLIVCDIRDFNKGYLKMLLVASLILEMIIDFNLAWIILLVSLIIFSFLSLFKRVFRDDINQLLLPIFLIIISAAFLFIDVKNTTNVESFFFLPREHLLDQKISWEIAINTLKSDFKNIILGSGIGTWYYDFSMEKSTKLNSTILWDVRLSSAGSYVSELLATMGVLGLISYLLIVLIFFLSILSLVKNKDFLPYVSVFSAILVGQFLYYQNTVLAFTFWFILGITASLKQIQDRGYNIKKSLFFEKLPELNLIPSVLLIVFSLLIFSSYYFLARFYLADVNYLKSVTATSITEKIEFLEKAVDLNPRTVFYRIMLARTYLSLTNIEFDKPLTNQDETVIQIGLSQAIGQAKMATEISPKDVATWETLGVAYRNLQFLAGDAIKWAIDSFQKASELEKTNPVLFTEIGKLYLASGEIVKAKENFIKAKELKPDYIDALIQEALIYERENNIDEALHKMEEMERNYAFNVEVKFQLGRLYLNTGKIDEAISRLSEVLVVNPNHSKALYSLAISYMDKGQKEEAIFVLERILGLNPGNVEIIKQIEGLKREELEIDVKEETEEEENREEENGEEEE